MATLAESGDWEALYQRLTLEEFPYEARMGWQLAFLRPFAVPRMAEILVQAGQLVDQPRKRAYDTGIIIYEIVHGGFDSPRAREMVRLINRSHHGYRIAAEDMTYVLCCFIDCPMRHIDLLGWRPLTAAERESGVRFFGRLGELMNIETVPRSYAEAEAIFDAYEASNVAVSQSSRLLTDNLIRVLKDLQPVAARPFTVATFTLLLNDRRVAEALGLRAPGRAAERAVGQLLWVYGTVKRQLPPSKKVIFTPGKDGSKSMYPHGYELGDLGPQATVDGSDYSADDGSVLNL